MTRRNALLFAAASLTLLATRASAHHSFVAAFDSKAPVTLTGIVTRVEWANPHVLFSITAEDSSGTAVTWRFELGAPNILLQRGWARTSLRPGETVTVDGFRARDGSHYATVVSVELANGRKLFPHAAQTPN